MTDLDKITEIVMQWADRCEQLCRLQPSRREFVKQTRHRVYEVVRDRIPPMGLETLKEKNPELYRQLLDVAN
jgi:hypothetical protein